jgi:hypothetical protein
MRSVRALACGLAPLSSAASDPAPSLAKPATAPATSPDELAGLWKARRWFGPVAGGPFALMTTFEYASPVHLMPDGPNRWSGQVVPFEDVFTFHLMLQRRPDGSLGAFLHNPERGFGADVDRLVRDGNVVKLIGKRPGQKEERELASGTYDADNEVRERDYVTRYGPSPVSGPVSGTK